jgi:hypothetical protein
MKKYPALRFFAAVCFVVGVIAILLGLLLMFIGFVSGHDAVSSSASPFALAAGYGMFAGSLLLILMGIGLLAIAESIKVFIDIEENTRETKDEIVIFARATKSCLISPPPATSPLHCAKCGTANSLGSKFCENCGAAL